MPVKVKKVKGGYKVTHGGKTSAKKTSHQNAMAQAALLRGVEHGWKPTGKKGRKYSKGNYMPHDKSHGMYTPPKSC